MWRTPAESLYHSVSKEKGDEVQKLNIVESLPQLLAEDAHSCITKVLPKIQQSLPVASAEFHMAVAVVFKQVLEQKLVSHSTFAEVFLQSILSSLDSREPAISHAWLETLLDVIELLPVDIIRREILPIAIKAGRISQTVNSRITSSRLLGKIATRFDSVSVQKEILPTVKSLHQDVSNEVRACVCLQLHFITQNLGGDIMKILPLVIELVNDEKTNVRQAAVQTIGHLLPQLPPDTIKDVVIPLIKVTCDKALKTEDDCIGIISQEFGKLTRNSESHLTLEEKTWFINYFIEIAQMGTIVMSLEESKRNYSFGVDSESRQSNKILEYRQNCAYNIPAMFLFASTVPDGINMLLPIFRNLANDSNYIVRRTIACSLHEIIKILGSKCGLIKIELLKLLKDNHEEVLQGLIPNISEILDRLAQNKIIGPDRTETLTIDLCRALIKCEDKLPSHNWRLSVQILNQFESLPKYFSSDFIYTYFVPVISCRVLYSRPLPVRLAAGRTLLVFLRYNLNHQQRMEIRNILCNDIARSSNCYMRMLFIHIMIEAVLVFSSMYFKEHFCSTLLSLMEDPISNIRYKMVKLVPTIKSCLRLPADKKFLSTLETNIRNLMGNEKDRDVSAALLEIAGEIERIEVRIDSQPSPTKLSKYDSEDMKKFEEEKKLEGLLTNRNSGIVGGLAKKRPPIKPSGNRMSFSGPSSPIKSSSRINSQTSNELSRSASIVAKPPLMRQNAVVNRQLPDHSKPSTSTDNLRSNWSRLTPNNSRFIKPWERTTSLYHNTSFCSTNPSCTNECSTQKGNCSCNQLTDSLSLTRPFVRGLSLQDNHCNLSACSYTNGLRPNVVDTNHDYQISSVINSSSLTNLRENKHGVWQDLILTRSSFTSKYNTPDADRFQSHCNPYWNFSSTPNVPLSLDDDFMVDAGIRLPPQISSLENSSRLTSLQDIIGNKRMSNNAIQLRRCASTLENTKPMNFGSSRRFSVEYENSGNPLMIPPSSLANSSRNEYECQYNQASGSHPSNRSRFASDLSERKLLDDKVKRGSTFTFKEVAKPVQSNNTDDKTMRYLPSYSIKLPDTKDLKGKFKRHSMEMDDYNPPDRSSANRTLRRLSILDFNHNQGVSKIPIRNIHSSGSRTVPVTRTSSPIRVESELIGNPGYRSALAFSQDGRLRRFRSSDEDIEKLCQKF